MSTIPGSTSLPRASIVARAAPTSAPTALIRSPSTATSAARGAAPVPSTRVPPRITRSCMTSLPCAAPLGAERDLDLLAAFVHVIGGRSAADRHALGAAVAHVELAAVHRTLED